MLLAGIQANSGLDPPIKTFGDDELRLRAQISSSLGEHKIINHFVVNSLLSLHTALRDEIFALRSFFALFAVKFPIPKIILLHAPIAKASLLSDL